MKKFRYNNNLIIFKINLLLYIIEDNILLSIYYNIL